MCDNQTKSIKVPIYSYTTRKIKYVKIFELSGLFYEMYHRTIKNDVEYSCQPNMQGKRLSYKIVSFGENGRTENAAIHKTSHVHTHPRYTNITMCPPSGMDVGLSRGTEIEFVIDCTANLLWAHKMCEREVESAGGDEMYYPTTDNGIRRCIGYLRSRGYPELMCIRFEIDRKRKTMKLDKNYLTMCSPRVDVPISITLSPYTERPLPITLTPIISYPVRISNVYVRCPLLITPSVISPSGGALSRRLLIILPVVIICLVLSHKAIRKK